MLPPPPPPVVVIEVSEVGSLRLFYEECCGMAITVYGCTDYKLPELAPFAGFRSLLLSRLKFSCAVTLE